MNTLLMEDVLVAGEDDWVPLLAVDGFARLLKLVDLEERRVAVLTTIRTLLNENLVEAGQLGDGGFQPWDQSPTASIARIAQNYLIGSADMWGFDTWFRHTSKGDEAALVVIAEREGEHPAEVKNATNIVHDCALGRARFTDLGINTVEVNPFDHPSALDEGVLVDVKFDAIRGIAMILLDMRCARQTMSANTAVVVARGAEAFSWERSDAVTPRRSWAVVSTAYHPRSSVSDLEMTFWAVPGATLRVRAQHFEVWLGTVPGLNEIPDLTEDDDKTVSQGYPCWNAEFVPLAHGSSGDAVVERSIGAAQDEPAPRSEPSVRSRHWWRGRRRGATTTPSMVGEQRRQRDERHRQR